MGLIIIDSPRGLAQDCSMGRKFFVGGNWKMNGTKCEIDDIVAFLKTGPLDPNVGTYLPFNLLFLSGYTVLYRYTICAIVFIFELY